MNLYCNNRESSTAGPRLALPGRGLSLARSIGAELTSHDIRINAVSPDPISTPFGGKLGLSADEKGFAVGVEGQVPLQRFGDTDEVTRAALFLASEHSGCVTRTEIVVDGVLSQF